MTTAATRDSMTGRTGTQRYPRLAVRLRVRLSTIDSETDPFSGKPFFRMSEETCANVSRGGAFVVTNETIPIGRRVLLELELPGGREVQATARVAWSIPSTTATPAGIERDCGIGVEFLGEPRDQLLELERFLARSFRRRRLTSNESDYFANTHRR